ncbi:MAG: hypothetical protein HY560_05050 [Gemmatimonadetes bacterium]|nr:hypothetical protein [Gemmatimonadota bacterium]
MRWIAAPSPFLLATFVSAFAVAPVLAQIQVGDPRMNDPMRSLKQPHFGGSSNVHVLSHIPLGPWSHVMDIEMEQELSRPYVYVARADWNNDPNRTRQTGGPVQYLQTTSKGVDIIDIRDPTRAKLIYSWRIPSGEIHQGTGGMDNKYFKVKGRYYDIQSLQFGNGPDGDVGAVVLDVTGLPDTTKVRQMGFIRMPDQSGGFHNFFMYKHSDGRSLLFTNTKRVYDMEQFLAGDAKHGLIGQVPVPEGAAQGPNAQYHDVYVGYDPATKRDVFYGAGAGGYHVYDVSQPEEPKLLTSISGVAGVRGGHTFTPDPTGRYAVTETEYQFSPLRLFDLKPGLDGTAKVISRPIGAWLGSWDGNSHNHEVRWPYVFVSGYMDGLQIFNLMDPTSPYTVGYYYTCDCVLPGGATGAGQNGGMDGAFGVDIRNADGVIVISDRRGGFYALKMDGFDGWNGHQWGLPNVSSVQDWDNGPDGAPRKVS